MSIHEIVKQAMSEHKSKIEVTQWALMSSVSSLVYSEYIRRMKQRLKPVHVVFVPSMHTLTEFMSMEGQFMTFMSEVFINRVLQDDLFHKYENAVEFQMFTPENVEIMKTILDLYILPNMSRRLSETIGKKFGIGDPNQQIFRESPEIDLFERQPINDAQMDYLVHQFILQMLALMPTIQKEIELPEENMGIMLAEEEVITISNENAICAIHFDNKIVKNASVIELLTFVTNTHFNKVHVDRSVTVTSGEPTPIQYPNTIMKDDRYVIYKVTTGPFNQVAITRYGEAAQAKTTE